MRSRTLLVTLALLAGVASPRALAAQSTVPLEPFGPERLRTVKVVVAGDTLDFLFDTGGGVTVISPALAARIGCTPAGRFSGYRMHGQRLERPVCRGVALQVGGVSSRRDAAVMELQPYGPQGPRVHGMVSLHTLASARTAPRCRSSRRIRPRHVPGWRARAAISAVRRVRRRRRTARPPASRCR